MNIQSYRNNWRAKQEEERASQNDAYWRGRVLAEQIGVRQCFAELGFVIAGLFLAYLLSEFWPGLAIVVTAAMCGGAICSAWRSAAQKHG